MDQERWAAVDDYLNGLIVRPDDVLDLALAEGRAAGLPSIDVSPSHGKFLHLLARIKGARTVLEIGTLAGYSTIWLARALPADGRLISLEVDPKHAEVARSNIQRAGLDYLVEIRVGSALETLPRLEAEGAGPFDLVFVDADKVSIPEYFAWALRLTQVGSVIVVDNVVRKGAIVDPDSTDPNVLGVRRFFELLGSERRVDASALQTVGGKGYDGLAIALVVADARVTSRPGP